MNSTLTNFGYPNSLIKSYSHWSVLLRPQQVTLGSLILGSHSECRAFGDLPTEALTELSQAIKEIEEYLKLCFKYDKINYLMLMMVDPHVHFHIIPRYSEIREFDSISCEDPGWPGPPSLDKKIEMTEKQLDELLNYIKAKWLTK